MSKILITGANRGIGLALAREFLKRGHGVFAGTRHPERSDDLRKLCDSGSGTLGQIQEVLLDVCSPSSVGQAYEAIRQRWPKLDVLINNAGVFPEEGDESFTDLDVEHFQTAFATNVTGVARMCQVFLPLLRQSDKPRIINISSGAGSISDKNDSRYYCYGASKAALNMFTRALAHELKEQGILTVALSPGWVKTEMGGPNAEITVEESARAIASTVLDLKMEQHGLFLSRHGDTTGYSW